MSIKTIKGVDDEAWYDFKSIASKNNVKMGKLFEEMVERYKEDSGRFWSDILKGEKILSAKEGKDVEKAVKRLRKDIGFRA